MISDSRISYFSKCHNISYWGLSVVMNFDAKKEIHIVIIIHSKIATIKRSTFSSLQQKSHYFNCVWHHFNFILQYCAK